MYTDDLSNYKTYPNTKSCYLDGRYFNKVLERYPGLISEPLVITIRKNKNTGNLKHTSVMKSTPINNKYPGLLRVVIDTPSSRHSNLVIIDYKNAKIFRFEPKGTSSPYFVQINNIIENYLDSYIDFDMYVLNTESYDQKNPSCDISGFCVAYVTKYAYDYVNNKKFDPAEILKFVSIIEDTYFLIDENKDIEYGLFGGNNDNKNQGRNTLIGGMGGAVIGSALTGGSAGGLIMGGLAGGILGGSI